MIARGEASQCVPQAMFSATFQRLRAGQIAGAADAVDEARAVPRVVIEVAVARHVLRVAAGGARQALVEAQRAQAVPVTLGVQQAERGADDDALAHLSRRASADSQATGPAAAADPGAPSAQAEREQQRGPAAGANAGRSHSGLTSSSRGVAGMRVGAAWTNV